MTHNMRSSWSQTCLNHPTERYSKEKINIYFPRCSNYSGHRMNVLNLVQNCEIDSLVPKKRMLQNFGIQQMLQNELFEEFPIQLHSDKVFCATWLSEQVIVMGTKCSKLLVYNIISNKLFTIPSLRSSDNSISCEHHCGIHAVAINPSKTMLATGAHNSNDVAVYTLPNFEPICVGEGAHSDWIFDIKWLDDEFFVSGARDGKISLWRVSEKNFSNYQNLNYYHMRPIIVKDCAIADKIRALHFNPPHELIAVSLNAYIHSWDMRVFKRLSSQKLPHSKENVCLAYNAYHKVYAVGSFMHVVILEGSGFTAVRNISLDQAFNIRSVGFRGDLLTVGTGLGKIFFYDIEGGDFISSRNKPVCLNAKRKKISLGSNNEYSFSYGHVPAIYTHSYDSSGTRLFAAGGPLPMNLYGYYAALWQ